jgi:hypothetical protein
MHRPSTGQAQPVQRLGITTRLPSATSPETFAKLRELLRDTRARSSPAHHGKP